MAFTIVAKTLINLFYPLHCAICKKPLDPLDRLGVCVSCVGQIRKNLAPFCVVCGRTVSSKEQLCSECNKRRLHFTSAYSACIYEGVVKELIHQFKYQKKIRLKNILSDLIADFLTTEDDVIKTVDVITPVPLHASRLRERGFNQSQVIAEEISKRFNIRSCQMLTKNIKTKHQNELSREERHSNVKNAFTLKKNAAVKGLSVLLVDDVMTTGATLSECARTLLASGVREVRCITIARGTL